MLYGGLIDGSFECSDKMFKLTLTQGRRTEALTAKIVILPDKLPINDRFYYNTYIFGSDGHIWVPGREALHVFDR